MYVNQNKFNLRPRYLKTFHFGAKHRPKHVKANLRPRHLKIFHLMLRIDLYIKTFRLLLKIQTFNTPFVCCLSYT